MKPNMRLTGREKILLIALAIVVGVFAYYRLIYLPESSNIAKLEETYKMKKDLYSQSAGSKKKIAQIEEQISKINSDIARIQKGTAKPIRVPELLDELSKKAESMGVSLDSIEFAGDAGAVKGSYKATGKESGSQAQDLLSSLSGSQTNITGTIPAQGKQDQPSQSTQQTADNNKTPALELRILELSFDIKGTYNNCMQFLKYYEGNERLFIVDDFQIKGSVNSASGSIKLLTYALAEKGEFKYDAGGSTGRTVPFSENNIEQQAPATQGTPQTDTTQSILDNFLKN